MLLADVLVAASELLISGIAPGGEAGPQAAHEAGGAAASSTNDAQSMESTPPSTLDMHLPCKCVGQCHGSHSSAAHNGLLHALGMHERCKPAGNLGNNAYILRPGACYLREASTLYGWFMVADLTAAQSDPQGERTAEQHLPNSKAQCRTSEAAVNAGNVVTTAPPASRRLPVPSERLLEHMLTVELHGARTADESKDYRSGIAARMYGECREATVAARVMEMVMKHLEEERYNDLPQKHVKSGRAQNSGMNLSAAAKQRVRAQVAASVKPEHRRLDKAVTHDLHAAALMLLAQLEADSSAVGDSRPEKLPSETRKAPANSAPQTSGMASKEQAASQLPTATSAAGAGKCPEGSSQRAASGHHTESKAASGALSDMSCKRTQQSAQTVSLGKAASKDGTGNGAAEVTAQRASLQLMAVDRSLQQRPPPPEGATQAARQHSSASQDASQRAASCAEESGSSSTARGAAPQAAAIPQDSTLTSDGQAAGSHSSPGRALSPPSFCRCLLLSLQVALIRPLADKTVIKHTLINAIRVFAHDHKMPPTCRELGRAQF